MIPDNANIFQHHAPNTIDKLLGPRNTMQNALKHYPDNTRQKSLITAGKNTTKPFAHHLRALSVHQIASRWPQDFVGFAFVYICLLAPQVTLLQLPTNLPTANGTQFGVHHNHCKKDTNYLEPDSTSVT